MKKLKVIVLNSEKEINDYWRKHRLFPDDMVFYKNKEGGLNLLKSRYYINISTRGNY